MRYLKGLWASSVYAGGISTTLDKQVLNEPYITVAGDVTDINFIIPVTYLRSLLVSHSNILRITLDVPNPCVAEQLNIQESKNSPKPIFSLTS